jgi:thymidylate synthase
LQFLIRQQRLQMITYMRSNDAFLGLPHDIFAFTMLQEIIARTLGCDLGTYKHAVGSLHLYERNRIEVQKYLNEGWQSTAPMPPMPKGDPWACIDKLLTIESAVRSDGRADVESLKLPKYWKDLARLLDIYRLSRRRHAGRTSEIAEIRRRMSTSIYDVYIEKRLAPKLNPIKK